MSAKPCMTRSTIDRTDAARLAALALLAVLGGCSDDGTRTAGSGGAGGASDPQASSSSQGGSDTQVGAGGEGGTAAEGGASPGGPQIHIHMRATTEPFSHDDELSGQTPLEHVSGVRRLELLKDASDPDPFVVFDLGQDFVEVDYADGADVIAHSLPAAELPAGTYTLARVVHSHVRYRIAATLHYQGLDLPGELDNVQVLSNGTMLDGVLRQAGWYEYVFVTGGQEFPATGDDAPVPEWSNTGGFSVTVEDGAWTYQFPVLLPLSPDVTEDVDVVLEVNMFESFRWRDLDEPDYAPGVFDTTDTTFEPVLRFGANGYSVYTE